MAENTKIQEGLSVNPKNSLENVEIEEEFLKDPNDPLEIRLHKLHRLSSVISYGNLTPKDVGQSLEVLFDNKQVLNEAISGGDPRYFVPALRSIDGFLQYYFQNKAKLESVDPSDGLSKKVNIFKDLSISLTEEILGKSDSLGDETGDLEVADVLFESARNLINFDEKKDIGINFLLTNLEAHYKKFLDLIPNSWMQSGLSFAKDVNIVFKRGNASQVNSIKDILTSFSKEEDKGVKKLLSYSLDFISEDSYTVIGDTLKTMLGQYNISSSDVTKLMESWFETGIKDPIGRNMEKLIDMEEKRPGISKVLMSEFGLYDFGRYPDELLIAQYDERDKKDSVPYGVLLYSYSDHNGAFYQNAEVLKNLFDQIHPNFRVRIFEVTNLLDLVRAINNSRHRYGKISFAMIAGHGQEDLVHLGGSILGKERGNLTKNTVHGKASLALKNAFVDKPAIILNSCTTGAIGGIGQALSELGGTIIAPSMPTSIDEIKAQILPEKKISFDVKYNEGSSNRFVMGEKKSA